MTPNANADKAKIARETRCYPDKTCGTCRFCERDLDDLVTLTLMCKITGDEVDANELCDCWEQA